MSELEQFKAGKFFLPEQNLSINKNTIPII